MNGRIVKTTIAAEAMRQTPISTGATNGSGVDDGGGQQKSRCNGDPHSPVAPQQTGAFRHRCGAAGTGKSRSSSFLPSPTLTTVRSPTAPSLIADPHHVSTGTTSPRSDCSIAETSRGTGAAGRFRRSSACRTPAGLFSRRPAASEHERRPTLPACLRSSCNVRV